MFYYAGSNWHHKLLQNRSEMMSKTEHKVLHIGLSEAAANKPMD